MCIKMTYVHINRFKLAKASSLGISTKHMCSFYQQQQQTHFKSHIWILTVDEDSAIPSDSLLTPNCGWTLLSSTQQREFTGYFQINTEFNNHAMLILPGRIVFKQFLLFMTSQSPFPLQINGLHVFPYTNL